MEGAEWPEPVVRVQSLSESGGATIPERYVKPEAERPALVAAESEAEGGGGREGIPVVDLSSPCDPETARAVSEACREWGFFQAVNHGVPGELLRRARGVWRGFFHQPMEVKQRYANSPVTYEGYGSRLGVEKGAVLDWGDYYFLHVRPPHLLSPDKWPHLPHELRETTEEYSREVAALCGRLMAAMSLGLGVGEARLQEAFGGAEGTGVCVRVNYYPRCPQPELTLGLSSHSDPGGMTVLLADDRVRGLQVRHRGAWVTVDPVPDAFIVNVGDQIQRDRAAELPLIQKPDHVLHACSSSIFSHWVAGPDVLRCILLPPAICCCFARIASVTGPPAPTTSSTAAARFPEGQNC
ncbi:jasmonate-induced oxygenase 1-like isoform X2 [Phragmites australis]|uniref:jasmonate-induced oxygenase 1-like isoform X2 n=1 Tax=Phragmites australis TaxID=29695 RepID=UPI002D76AAC5|nr:jasmonate-induced oxygenase 1-like isoform X2 [Phragmites australis]